MVAMLEDTRARSPDAAPADAGESVLVSREMLECVFRSNETARFGNMTERFGDRDRRFGGR